MTFAARFIGWVKSLVNQIQRSLRFRASASAWLFRNVTNTPADTNQRRKTYLVRCKRGSLGSVQELIANYVSTDNFWGFYFSSDDRLCFYAIEGGAVQASKFSSAVFRDPTAHLDLLLVTDTANATAEDRIQIWVNGVRITSWNTNTTPALNAVTAAAFIAPGAGTWFLNIGRLANASNYFDGYFSEVIGVDGQALTPSSFGESDSSGNWRPKAYTGTYGTNGFRLDFSDPTSLTTLMADRSGNGNNWTASNISLTAGGTYDSMLDVPLGGGGNERGNYCTWNPLDSLTNKPTQGNLRVGHNNGEGTRGTHFNSTGKWYFEFIWDTLGVGSSIGVAAAAQSLANSPGSGASFGCNPNTGNKSNGGANTAYGPSLTTGDVMMCAYDLDNGKIWWGKNGTWAASGDPAAGTNAAYTGLVGPFAPMFGVDPAGTGNGGHANFGQRPFAYTPPSGFKALHTGNLPEPVIANPQGHHKTALWTGDGISGRQITGVGFESGLVWIKARDAAYDALLFDAARGAGKSLTPSSTGAEGTNSGNGYLSAFGADGFTLTAGGSGIVSVNESGRSYAAWCFKAGGAPVANNIGSVASQVSVNAMSGFSVVTYTGALTTTGSRTIGHGLPNDPKLVISKSRNTNGADSGGWMVQHSSLGTDDFLYLNSSAAVVDAVGSGGGTLPKPAGGVFYSTWNSGGCVSGNNYVAYCFSEVAGYSKIGMYIGGVEPLVHCGFEPAFVLVKRTDGTTNWSVMDSARDPFNSALSDLLAPNSSAAELTNYLTIDFTATGFKIRNTDATWNASGSPYIFLAIAKTPMKYALAR